MLGFLSRGNEPFGLAEKKTGQAATRCIFLQELAKRDVFLHPTPNRFVFTVVMNPAESQIERVSSALEPPPSHGPNLQSLFLDFRGELRGFIRSKVDSEETCDDLLQTTFLRAQSALERGTAPREPRAWLYQIARHLLVDTYRSESRRNRARTTDPQGENTEDWPPHEGDEREISALIARALPQFIAALPETYSRALEMVDLEGKSQNEAAEREGVSLACMKARVRRGRAKLLEALQRCCEFKFDRRGGPIACRPRQEPSCSSCS